MRAKHTLSSEEKQRLRRAWDALLAKESPKTRKDQNTLACQSFAISLTTLDTTLDTGEMRGNHWSYCQKNLPEVEKRLGLSALPSPLTPDEALAWLRKVEAGEITLSFEVEPQGVCGNVRYTAPDGAEVVLFNDCNEWDYVDSLRFADGRALDFNDFPEDHPVSSYKPSEEAQWTAWKIPGYLYFKCMNCGHDIQPPSWGTGDSTCIPCGGKALPPQRPCSRCRRDRHKTEPKDPCFVCSLPQQLAILQEKKGGD